MQTQKKESYESPRIEVEEVELEQGIAAGSAEVNPGTGDTNIDHEWDEGGDVDQELEW